MEYDYKQICERIVEERKKLGLTQQSFLKQLRNQGVQMGGNRLSNIENGVNDLTLNELLSMCNIFNCDLGYLIGEYDCKTLEKKEIQEYTGLSEKAIDFLHLFVNLSNGNSINDRCLDFINSFITGLVSDPITGEDTSLIGEIVNSISCSMLKQPDISNDTQKGFALNELFLSAYYGYLFRIEQNFTDFVKNYIKKCSIEKHD